MGPLARSVRAVAGPGFLLTGDAAGFFDPFTGEGVHRALVGAELAEAGIESALSRPDRQPAGYAEDRRRVFRDKERLCLLVQLFLISPRTLGYALTRLERRPGRASTLAAALGDYAPASSALQPGQLAALLCP
jgi:flavin-dependent dehydrogenase